jgi:hypothetical protein
MRKLFEIGGLVAAVVLIGFGVAAIAMGVGGRSTVQDSLKQEQIIGTPDMTPSAIAAEVTADRAAQSKLIATMKAAGVTVTPSEITTPTCSVAGETINSGSSARCFAQYMRIHALEATGGLTYAQMPHYATKDGKGTNDTAAALTLNGRPVDNPARNVWVNETALSTALNTSFFATQVSTFSILMGIALLLSGIGFAVLAAGGALRNRETPLGFLAKHDRGSHTAVPTT